MTWSFRTNGDFIDFIHTDNTSIASESLVRSLHNTSRSVEWSLPMDTTRINFSVAGLVLDNILITDIDFDGVVMDSQDDFETGITAMFTGLAASPGGSSFYVYKAAVTQSGSSAPTVTKLFENTLPGDTTFSRDGVGNYRITNAVAFADYTKVFIPGGSDGGGLGVTTTPISDGSSVIGYYRLGPRPGFLDFITSNTSFVDTEFRLLFDGTSIYIEIQVYP